MPFFFSSILLQISCVTDRHDGESSCGKVNNGLTLYSALCFALISFSDMPRNIPGSGCNLKEPQWEPNKGRSYRSGVILTEKRS